MYANVELMTPIQLRYRCIDTPNGEVLTPKAFVVAGC